MRGLRLDLEKAGERPRLWFCRVDVLGGLSL